MAWGDPLAGDTFATISATGLEAAPGGLLVFGAGAAGPVVVSSSDGQQWNEAPLGADGEEAVAAAEYEGTWIIVCRNLDKDGTAVGQIWRSDDRQAWSMVLELRDGELFDVEATAEGFMVVGYPDLHASRYQATVWHSGDGLTWEPEELAAEVAFAIERLPDGRAAIATKDRRGLTVWLGDRGRWSPSRVAGDGLVSSLVAGPDAILLAGQLFDEDGSQARLWRSPDGASWERVDQTVAERVHVETATGSEFVGWEYVEGDAAALWTSRDGQDWTPEPKAPFGPGIVAGMAYRDGVVYAVVRGPQGGTALWAGTVVSP